MGAIRRRLLQKRGEKEPPNYLCFTALKASTVTISHAGTYAISLEYSLDGNTWSAFDYNTTISLATGESAYIRGNNTAMAYNSSSYNYFILTGSQKQVEIS